jgi:hypothetical protein
MGTQKTAAEQSSVRQYLRERLVESGCEFEPGDEPAPLPIERDESGARRTGEKRAGR